MAGRDGAHPTPFQFAGAWGYQREPAAGAELGLDYLSQRYYDAELGRFISADPIGLAGGLNLYAYTANDPVNAVDPSGLSPGDADEGVWNLAVDIAYLRRHGPAGGVDPTVMARVNKIHQRNGLRPFASGDQPLISHVMLLYSMVEGGGLGCSPGGGRSPRGGGGKGGGGKGGDVKRRPPLWEVVVWYARQRFGRIPSKLDHRPVPSGFNPSTFGSQVMRWGTGEAAALARIPQLSREELSRAGVTVEMARAWRDLYRNDLRRNPWNGTAAGRVKLMHHAMKLLRGR